jgi:hypothetical protein
LADLAVGGLHLEDQVEQLVRAVGAGAEAAGRAGLHVLEGAPGAGVVGGGGGRIVSQAAGLQHAVADDEGVVLLAGELEEALSAIHASTSILASSSSFCVTFGVGVELVDRDLPHADLRGVGLGPGGLSPTQAASASPLSIGPSSLSVPIETTFASWRIGVVS